MNIAITYFEKRESLEEFQKAKEMLRLAQDANEKPLGKNQRDEGVCNVLENLPRKYGKA